MASITCKYCNNIIQNVRNLSRHQLSAKCVTRQRELGLNPQSNIHVCDCGFSSNRKDKFELHKKKCTIHSSSSSSKIADNITNNVTNNITNNITNITNTQINIINIDREMTELFLQRIKDRLSADTLRELCEKGYGDLSDHVIVNSIKNEDGKSDVRIADAARQKLITKTITGNLEEDIGAHKTKARIGAAVDEVLSWSHKKAENSTKILETIRTANNDRKDGRQDLRKRILTKCPRTFDETLSIQNSEISPLEKILEEADRKEAEKKEQSSKPNRWLRKFMSRSFPIENDGLLANRHMKLVIRPGINDFAIVGALCELTKNVITLDSVQIKELEEAGVGKYIAPNAKPKIYIYDDPKEIITDTICHTSYMEFLPRTI